MRKTPKRNWEDPYYTYSDDRTRITIDVTGSIPNFTNPVDGLGDVAAGHFRPRGFVRILDFGAGKLRNTLYLLRLNYEVTAVEFQEAYANDRPAGANRLAQARRFGRFAWVLPRDLLGTREQFDAALLVNVVNVVPDDADRRRIIRACATRLRLGGLLLIMTQYGEPNYEPGATNRRSLNDGFYYNLHKTHRTFNIEFTLPKLRALAPGNLLREVGPISSAHHRALLFERV